MLVRAQTIIPFRTNLPRDVVSNTMWFQVLPEHTLTEAALAIAPNIADFYRQVYLVRSGNGCQASYLNLVGAFTNFYNQDAPPPRVPYRVDLGLADAVTSDTRAPTEVACVLSFRAALENGVPAARRRGRIFLGGLGDGTLDGASGASPYFPRFNQAWRERLIAALQAQFVSPEDWGGEIPSEDIVWSVYSQKDHFSAPVVAGWIDNTPDTQRRRGVNANARTVWPS